MAAVLIDIKSRMLLPRPPAEPGEEELDPRAALMRQLLEYERIKQAAEKLDEIPRVGREFAVAQSWMDDSLVKKLPEVNLVDLQNAWFLILSRARINRHHHITREQLSVREHMSRILKRLRDQKYVEFTDLFEPGVPVPVVVVNFIAILELVKESLAAINQAEAYAPIYLSLVEASLREENE
jgi:segregation and condensation protein A